MSIFRFLFLLIILFTIGTMIACEEGEESSKGSIDGSELAGELNCTDGIDNDNDTEIDCDDIDCLSDFECFGIIALCPEINLNSDACDPETGGPFSLEGASEFFPLVAGNMSVLEGVEIDDEGEEVEIRIESYVLDETEMVAGVETRVVEESEFEDGELVEVARDFYAVLADGTVCYFGEDVDNYEDGMVVDHEGAWRAGENGNKPGIIMPGDPQVGQIYMQEDAPGNAEDQAENIALGEELDVPAGVFDNTLNVEDCNPLDEGARDEKVYVSGIGIAKDEVAELVSFEEGME